MGALLLDEEKYYTIDEVADKLGVTRFSIYNFMKETDLKKRLNFIYIGKRRRVSSTELKRYLSESGK
jgi:excisionase family DNA binding protein